ncbi:hypothetical protein Ddye_026390 [Dipteronia dyeriana]|uniref:Uncharacterized protein n=1 Tax=Dipteronia dyeriana TaxID=168575 RepID=A0AAD9WQH8_9ROSI|nr:hypothetical protein Ddye_026390 [Dipteronia dyeriana]
MRGNNSPRPTRVVSRLLPKNDNIQEVEKEPEKEPENSDGRNEDLDQYLLHPRTTWAYDITITVHCKLKLIHDIKEVLGSCGEFEEFKKSCFKHYLDLPHYMRSLCQTQYIHNLLLCQIRLSGANDDEMWFAMGNTNVRLRKIEFCLCTGLKFGVLTHILLKDYVPVKDGIHMRYFDEDGYLLLD